MEIESEGGRLNKNMIMIINSIGEIAGRIDQRLTLEKGTVMVKTVESQ